MGLTIFLLIVFSSQNFPSVSTEGCNSLQYLEIGMPGIIQCFFQENYYAVSWFYSERKESIILYKESEKSGIGYTSGEFDILKNGSLVIRKVSVDDETIYRVSKFTSITEQPANFHITVKTIVKPTTAHPVIDVCPAGQQSCLVSVKTGGSIGCFVNNSRPSMNLTWTSLSFETGQVLPFVYRSAKVDNITFTSNATVTYSLSKVSLLNVFVCQASSIPGDLIVDWESSVLIDKESPYTAIGTPSVWHIEMSSTMILRFSYNNSTAFIWKKLATETDLWSTILYSIPSPNEYMESYQTDFEVDNEGSLMVKYVSLKHEGLYVCIHSNGDEENVTLYEVDIYVNPVPAYPVIEGCNNKQYCVLHVRDGDYITCSVHGIRPVVELEWNESSGIDTLSFEKQNRSVTETGGVYDVSLISRISLHSPSKERTTIKCSVTKSSTHLFEMSTSIDILFDNAVNVIPGQPSRVIGIVAVVAAAVVIVLVVITIAMYIKLKGSPQRGQQSPVRDRNEETPMMEISPESSHTGHATDKEATFIKQLKAKYEMLYNSVQPIPYVRDRMFCVDKVFIESDIEYLDQSADPRHKENWKLFGSYNDLLGKNSLSSDRDILEAEPGYGKSTITLQLAYDWCNAVKDSPLSDIGVLILLRLRELGGVSSIFEAIRRFILPRDSKLTDTDVRNVIERSTSVVILLDGYDEYPDQDDKDTDIYRIISKDIFRKVKVLITTRSSYLPKHRAPQCFRLRLLGFDDTAREKYIRKAVVGDDDAAAKNIKLKLQENPLLEDLCEVPLFFVMFVHITHENKNSQAFKSVTGFFRHMIRCFHSHMRNKMEEENVKVVASLETEHADLDKVAFKAMTGETQQIWKREELLKKLGTHFYDHYVKVGILVEDETLNVLNEVYSQSEMESSVEVRFYHKLFCAWYAAHYLITRMTKPGVSTSSLLANIDPFDLQYLYRFACGISKDASKKIIKYLRTKKEGQKFAILCILEQEHESSELLESVTVTELLSKMVIISQNDTRLLQRSTLKILGFASENEIPILDLCLHWSFKNVDGGDIVLRSDLRLPRLLSLKKLAIDGDSTELSEDDVIGLLNYGLQSQTFQELWFYTCELPEFIRRDAIPPLSITRNVNVLRPDYATKFDLQSGKWTEITEIEDIKLLCSDDVVIDKNTSKSTQKSVIDVLEKASKHDIPIFCVYLLRCFHSVNDNGEIILTSDLPLPSLSSLEMMEIWTEDGRELDEDEANGILNYISPLDKLNELVFSCCLLPAFLLESSLGALESRGTKVFWYPYAEGERSYQLDLTEGHWLLNEKPTSLFPTKSTGDVLTTADYDLEATAFRARYRKWDRRRLEHRK